MNEKEKIVPYVGATGFMGKGDVRAVLDARSPWSRRKTMIGIFASSETINGETNSHPNRYPTAEQMGNIFDDAPRAINLVQFSTKNREGFFEEMARAFNLAGPYCHGLQLNIAWPDPSVLEYFKTKAYPVTIVLKIGKSAFEMIGHSPQKLADKIEKEYKHLDYILLDSGGDKKNPFDPCVLGTYLHALERKRMAIGLGVSGRMSIPTLYAMALLIKEFPNLSISAEVGARYENGRLDPQLAISFNRKAEYLFG